MRFRKITISNFGPFKDTETLDFTSNDGVNIVWGDNGGGKTSLLNAFNFVLFNTVKDRNGKTNDFISYINRDGYKAGNYTYKVSLDVEDGDDKYKFTRNLLLQQGVTVPETSMDVRTMLTVTCNGIIQDKDTGEHILSSMITPEVSRFFLFDGELLEEYETLLDENSPTGGSIKEAIEQILGVPVLTYGYSDVCVARDRISTNATKIAQNDTNTKVYADTIADYKAERDKQSEELSRLTAHRDELLEKRKEIQQEIDDTQKLRELIAKRTEHEAVISSLEVQKDELHDEIVELLGESWKWIYTPTVKRVADSIEEDLSTLREKETFASVQEKLISYIQSAIDTDFCPICEHENDESEKARLQKKIQEIKDGSIGLSSEERTYLSESKARLSTLRQYIGTQDHSGEIRNKCQKIADIEVRIEDIRSHALKPILDQISAIIEGGGDEGSVADIMRKSENNSKELQIVDTGIQAQKDAIARLDDLIQKTTKKLLLVSKNRDVILAGKKKDFAEHVSAIFEQGVDTYRERLRRKVESDATDIFRAMNSETDYDRLSINNNYGLSIVLTGSGELAPKSSAGWIHMVAFALIGALHNSAPFEGPVVMDSPFGRMSSKNTANMVKAIPLISKQVLLLPLPGEIDDQRTRFDIGDKIVQEKMLTKLSATHSKIEEM